MPLFMDIHTLDADSAEISEESLAAIFTEGHIRDIEVQDKYGVIQHKYWVNKEAKAGFCLMEAPDKDSCEAVHKEAHGHIAYNIIEVSDLEFNLFLGKGTKNETDLAHTLSGELDNGYRTILLVSVVDLLGKYNHYITQIHQLIEQHEGDIILLPNDDIMVSFVYSSNTVLCALAIAKLLKPLSGNFEYCLSIVTGIPVDKEGTDLFEDAKKKIYYLNKIGSNGLVYLDNPTKKMLIKESNYSKLIDENKHVIVNEESFVFLDKLFTILKTELYKPNFKSEQLNELLLLSKSQLYRKMKSTTQKSPNSLIQELRLQESLREIKSTNKTIAEIAYDLGFNSPSYFTKVFSKRFGILPTTFYKNSIK